MWFIDAGLMTGLDDLKVFSNLNDSTILYKLLFKRKYLGLLRVGVVYVLIVCLILKPADMAGKNR